MAQWKESIRKCMSKELISNQGLCKINSSFVAISGYKSKPFRSESGLLQGSLSSPVLYSILVDDLVEKLRGIWSERILG